MTGAVSTVLQASMRDALARAADATGVDFEQLLETARRESSLNSSARAATSSAAGLFQFIESTWLTTVARYGAQHGLAREAAAIDMSSGRPVVRDPAARRAILDLRYDPEASARMAGEFTRENAAALERALGRAPTTGELYAAHVLGAGGATRLIQAARDGASSAADIFPREAAANRALFFAKDGAPRSAQGLLERLARSSAPVHIEPAEKASQPSTSIVPADPAELVEEMRAAMMAALFRTIFDDGGTSGGAATRLFGLDAYAARLRD